MNTYKVAYKVVSEINGRLYSYITVPRILDFNLKYGLAVQYELNKKTTYKRNVKGNKFLYCFKSIYDVKRTVAMYYNVKIFECTYVKSKSKSISKLTHREKKYTIPASSVTLTKDITDQVNKIYHS